MEFTTVTGTEVVVFSDGALRVTDGLDPDTDYEFSGHYVRTLPVPGPELARLATVNDVHFGETRCGAISGTDMGPTFGVDPGEEPYPELMNRGALAEIKSIQPDAVIVKGDLTSDGEVAQFERFLEVYQGSLGDSLMYVRGNHDAYHGVVFADTPMQERAVEGATIALLDTARVHQVNGSLSSDQLEWLDELAARTDTNVMVFGHHHVWNPEVDPRIDDFFGLQPSDSEALFEVFARRPNLVGYFAGHTHRNRCQFIRAAGGAPFIEVASVKDFPGAVAEYRIYETGISQIFRRISLDEALVWTEKTRGMYEGGYGSYAFGKLRDRNLFMNDRRL